MTKTELSKLLDRASAIDDRLIIGVETVEAWHPFLALVNVNDAWVAVEKHYATSTFKLLPAHVLDLVRLGSGPSKMASDISNYCRTHDGYPLPCARCLRDEVTL